MAPFYFMISLSVMIFIAVCLLGVCLGSFVNALVWRLHEQGVLGKENREKRKEGTAESSKTRHSSLVTRDLSILRGRSMCPHCEHRLAWYDLLPVLSWLQLEGKCRYCKQRISIQYPLVEIMTSILFIVSYSALRPGGPLDYLAYGLWAVLLVLFMALVVYDLRWMLLPDKLTRVASAAALLLAAVTMIQDGFSLGELLGPVLGIVGIAGVFYILFQISKGKWIGGGDVKLGVSLGLIAGSLPSALLIIFLASLVGSLVGVPMLLRGKKKQKRIPFGPFLIAATIFTYLYGQKLIDWYLGLAGL